MDKREQTRMVRLAAESAERNLDALTECAEADLGVAGMLGRVAGVAERSAELVRLAARNAVELAVGGTETCKRHADRAVAARNVAVDLAATVRRAVEVERLRRAEAAHAKRTMLERDYPALAAVVACAPNDTYFLDTAVALVRSDDYRAVASAMDTFGPAECWTSITLPDTRVVTPFITEDTDARELAGVIRAYVERAEAYAPLGHTYPPMHGTSWETPAMGNPAAVDLDEILAAAHAAGWRAPGVAFGESNPDVDTRKLDDGYEVAVWGGDDDYAVAEAATLAVARHGIFDDDHRPDDHDEEWWAWIVPGVPVWLPHVEAWHEDMDYDSDTLTMRQMDRAFSDWEDWGERTYGDAYYEAYRDAILDAETPETVGEAWDSGVTHDEREEEADERAQAAAEEVSMSLGDLGGIEYPLDADDIVAHAREDARHHYRETVRSDRPVERTIPLF